mgnify:CR=1 FL=1
MLHLFSYPLISYSLKLVKLAACGLALAWDLPYFAEAPGHLLLANEILRSGQLPIGLGLFH